MPRLPRVRLQDLKAVVLLLLVLRFTLCDMSRHDSNCSVVIASRLSRGKCVLLCHKGASLAPQSSIASAQNLNECANLTSVSATRMGKVVHRTKLLSMANGNLHFALMRTKNCPAPTAHTARTRFQVRHRINFRCARALCELLWHQPSSSLLRLR